MSKFREEANFNIFALGINSYMKFTDLVIRNPCSQFFVLGIIQL